MWGSGGAAALGFFFGGVHLHTPHLQLPLQRPGAFEARVLGLGLDGTDGTGLHQQLGLLGGRGGVHRGLV